MIDSIKSKKKKVRMRKGQDWVGGRVEDVKFRHWAKRGARLGRRARVWRVEPRKVEESTVHFIDAIKTNIIPRRKKSERNRKR